MLFFVSFVTLCGHVHINLLDYTGKKLHMFFGFHVISLEATSPVVVSGCPSSGQAHNPAISRVGKFSLETQTRRIFEMVSFIDIAQRFCLIASPKKGKP